MGLLKSIRKHAPHKVLRKPVQNVRRAVHKGVQTAVIKPAIAPIKAAAPYVRKYGPTVARFGLYAVPAAGIALAAYDVKRTRERSKRTEKKARRFKRQADAESLAVEQRIGLLRGSVMIRPDRTELTPVASDVDGLTEEFPNALLGTGLFPSNPNIAGPVVVEQPEPARKGSGGAAGPAPLLPGGIPPWLILAALAGLYFATRKGGA